MDRSRGSRGWKKCCRIECSAMLGSCIKRGGNVDLLEKFFGEIVIDAIRLLMGDSFTNPLVH